MKILTYAIFIVLATSFLLCSSIEGLNYTPYFFTIIALIGVFIAVALWRCYRVDAESDKIVSTIDHDFFGKVDQRKDYWEATVDIDGFGKEILVSGYANNFPTKMNVETVKWLMRSSDKIYRDIIDGLHNYYQTLNRTFDSSVEVNFMTVMMDENEPLCFMMGFDIPELASSSDFYSFTGTFEKGNLVDLSVDH